MEKKGMHMLFPEDMQRPIKNLDDIFIPNTKTMDLLTYLKENPEARERSNKNKVIAKFVWENNAMEFGVTKHKISNVVGEILNLDRKWRLILKENPELRGTDYNDKARLEEDKLVELGYGQTP